MIVTTTQVRKLPGMSMTGLAVEQDIGNPLGVIVRAGQIVLANGVTLSLPTDTPVVVHPNPSSQVCAIISLTQSAGLVLTEWTVTSGVFQPYSGGVFCDLAQITLPAGCTNLTNVEISVPVLV